jgi:3-hydroxyacyl-CoA dehydrogenase
MRGSHEPTMAAITRARMNVGTNILTLRARGGIAILKADSPPVNTLSHAVRQALEQGLSDAIRDASVKAIVIMCAGRTFFAGADINEFGQAFRAPRLHELCATIETSSKPIVAAIHGTALGGGFELALACHYRLAVPSAKVGLPEVTLGLLPGAGGTQRMPRLAGVAAALDLIAFGRSLSAIAAKNAGMLDELVEGDLEECAVEFAQMLIANKAPLRRVRDLTPDLKGTAAADFFAAFRIKHATAFKGFKAPDHIILAVEAAVKLPFDQGLVREAELFAELISSAESAAQRHIFFAERAAAKVPRLAADTKIIPVTSISVVGAGTMGTGIALTFLNAGLPVTLIDRDAAAIQRSADTIARTLQGAAAKRKISETERKRRESLLSTSVDMASVAGSDLIIEAVNENLDLKKNVFRQLDAIAAPAAILASNTSFLDLDAIAAATNRPSQVVGLHFFAPANIMRLLEVVRGKATSDELIATAMDLGRKLGKVTVLSCVCDGFIANRAMARRVEAAERLILEGPMPWDIDRAMTEYGFPMGVFAMLDLVGLDVIGWDGPASAGRTVQEVLCESGRWGQKRGAGYYDYIDQRRASPSPITEQVIRQFSAKIGISPRQYSNTEIIERLLYPVVNEGAKLLEEKVAMRASDVDVALVAGYGWPVYTGGPMFWADRIGLPRVIAGLEHTSKATIVSPLLRKLASDGKSFTDFSL